MSVPALINRIIHIIRFSLWPSGPVDDFEYPNYTDNFGRSYRESVGRWKYSAAIGYYSPDHITKSQVTEMWWYKNIEGLEHEYIIVACHRAGEIDAYLRLERRPLSSSSDLVVPERALPREVIEKFNKAEYTAFQADVATERRFIQKAIGSALQRSIPSSKNALICFDSVTRLYGPRSFFGEEAQLITHCDNFKRPFYVRDLAFLADRISARQLNHQSLAQRSYWYAQMFINLVIVIYQPTISGDSQLSAAGTYTVAQRPTSQLIALCKNCEDSTIQDVRTEFEEALLVHDRQVEKRYFERTGRQLELEQRLEEERKKRLELEERLARYQQEIN